MFNTASIKKSKKLLGTDSVKDSDLLTIDEVGYQPIKETIKPAKSEFKATINPVEKKGSRESLASIDLVMQSSKKKKAEPGDDSFSKEKGFYKSEDEPNDKKTKYLNMIKSRSGK